jgi:hypothetical protein
MMWPLFRIYRATEIDPNFALAYATLGVANGNNSESKAAEENLKRAFALKERATEPERFTFRPTTTAK